MKRLLQRIIKTKQTAEQNPTIAPEITLENFPEELDPELVKNYLELLSRGQLTTDDMVEDMFFYNHAIQKELLKGLPHPYTSIPSATTEEDLVLEAQKLRAKPNSEVAQDFRKRKDILTQKAIGIKRFTIQSSPEGNPPFVTKVTDAISTSLANHITPENSHLVKDVANRINNSFTQQNQKLAIEVAREQQITATNSPYAWHIYRQEKTLNALEAIEAAKPEESIAL